MSGLTRRRLMQGAGMIGLGLLTACGRLPRQAPPPAAKVHQIAILLGASPDSPASIFPSAIRQGLSELGYIEGQSIVVEQRNATGEAQFAAAAELVRHQPDVIATPSVNDTRSALAATTSIPIVSGGNGDLVASGVVASLARPGGNVTGLSTPVLVGKQLQLLQEAVPTLSRVAVLFDSNTTMPARGAFEAAAGILGLQLQFVGAVGPEDLTPALGSAIREHADGLFVLVAPLLSANQPAIADLAMQRGLPSMWQASEAVGHGGLVAYGPNRPAMYRRVAYFVDRILNGANPADLPVEQPREFDFVINLKTAQALGLTIPQHVLLQATEIIQ
jgi:putative tryptophan/tyrosine transport system substrate-binding protein